MGSYSFQQRKSERIRNSATTEYKQLICLPYYNKRVGVIKHAALAHCYIPME